jgi:uncharacterized protein (UPF0276 family)
LKGLPTARIAYGHVAGHYREHDSLLIDTHGSDVSDPVWALLSEAYLHHGIFPTLLERDFNIPDMPQLQLELAHIRRLQPTDSKQLRA